MFAVIWTLICFFVGRAVGINKSEKQLTNFQTNLKNLLNSEVANAKDEKTKKTLEKIIGTIWVSSDQDVQTQSGAISTPSSSETTTETQGQLTPATNGVAQTALKPEVKKEFDATSWLLYFGAFLFLSSAGLLAAVGDFGGIARVISLAIMFAVTYFTGLYIYNHAPKLRQPGLTFVGIGLAILPFIGVVMSVNVFASRYENLIWLVTSLVVLGAYVATLYKVRSTFIAYMLIGSILSLFLSSASLLDPPIYLFNWSLVICGIVLKLISLRSDIVELKNASDKSSQFLVPLTVATSLFLIGTEGTLQMAGSLLLGSIYYALQYKLTTIKDKVTNYVVAHGMLVASVAFFVYSLNDSIAQSAVALLVVNLAHLFILYYIPTKLSEEYQYFTQIIIAVGLSAIIISLGSKEVSTLATTGGAMTGLLVAHKSQKKSAFLLCVGSWVLLSLLLGQYLVEPSLSAGQQALLSFGFSVPIMAGIIEVSFKKISAIWRDYLNATLVILQTVGLLFSIGDGFSLFLILSVVSVLSSYMLYQISKIKNWLMVSALFSIAPLLIIFLGSGYTPDSSLRSILGDFALEWVLSASVLVGLVVNIVFAFRHKFQFSRIASTLLWLALPLTLGHDKLLGIRLEPEFLMALYTIVAVVLAVSRAIALGRIFSALKVPLESLSKQSSFVYEAGVLTAISASVAMTFWSEISLLVPVAFIVVNCAIFVAYGFEVEKNQIYFGAVPLFTQILLTRLAIAGLDASDNSGDGLVLNIYAVSSFVVALMYYSASKLMSGDVNHKVAYGEIAKAGVLTAFSGSITFAFLPKSVWGQSVALICASLLLLHYKWQKSQATRELIGGVVLVGVFWFLKYHGVNNIQVYTHLLASLFAIYAYWRNILKDKANSNIYLRLMLAVATIPLVIQALGNEAGGMYGIWLLLEQVAFLLIGIALKDSFVIKWGSYVAIGAVLYQLKGLGWMFLIFLSLVIIGIAVYRTIKQQDNNPKEDERLNKKS